MRVRWPAPPRQKGFTLIELLVVMVIMSIMAFAAFSGLGNVIAQRQSLEAEIERQREIIYTVRRMAMDFRQLQPRPVRDQIGDSLNPALIAEAGGLEMTVGGWSNPLGRARPSLQRVSYQLEGSDLVRLHWPVLDRTLGTEPLRRIMLKDIVALQVRYLDPNRAWQERWPPLSANSGDPLRELPLAVEFTIELEDEGLITRLVEVLR